MEIPQVLERTLDAHEPFEPKSIEDVLKVDLWARERAGEEIEKIRKGAESSR